MKALNAIRMGGVDVLPLVEGGKGVAVSNGFTCGAWASSGGAGTFSAVNPDSYDAEGHPIPQTYHGRTRRDRHEELVEYAIAGGIAQAQQAHDIAGGRGRIHANLLWEMGGAERVITGVLEGARGLINGITCGAGMPYRLSEIAARFGVYYYPIVSSSRAFNALWKRAYSKAAALLGGVVYEDPWLAGGHNGLSNGEAPDKPEDPFPRVLALRKLMRTFGLDQTPIIMAGGVWWLEEWQDWIDNPELGPIAFPVRHTAAADPGIADQPRLEATPAQPEAGRCLPEPLQPDRLLLQRGQQRFHVRAARPERAPGRVFDRAGG